ncbi:hypothetical protein SAMN05421768_108269 [Chryseobacterium joostei]|uniref:Uncharacterized protein n=1 Tax=Chryseobacterium joostei TaxID=112234 RepID=A0A1N7JGA1_9FLAO|nr:hypothetical protein SAMN05421768_102270 [Chryseobacterium joostei]SIS48357.1 hypothetical protein SAMN05421768_108269 [Chryseobacterium joostei]
MIVKNEALKVFNEKLPGLLMILKTSYYLC